MESIDIGLNSHHNTGLVNFLRFSKYQRAQCLRSVSACFEDIKETRLTDETYTQDEIEELISDLATTVKSEVETELINYCHTNAILLQNIFKQAEKWHLKIDADTREMENEELLKQIKTFEESEVLGKKNDRKSSPVKTKLEPIFADQGGILLLQKKIDQLTKENITLKEQMKQVESEALLSVKDKSSMGDEMKRLKFEMDELQSGYKKSGMSAEEKIECLNRKLKETEDKLTEMSERSSSQSVVSQDLSSTKHRLLELQSQLELTEKEVEKKFSQTGAYNNMKKMLLRKNDQIKEMRSRLQQYEPDANFDEE